MTRLETIGIIELIRRAYPRFIEPSAWEPDVEKAVSNVVDLWTEMFATDHANTVVGAVKQYIRVGKFPPTVADIQAIITDATTPKVMPGDIWQECHRLLNWTISPEDEERAYANMSDICREAVLAVGGWYALSMSPENDPYIRRTFMQAAQSRIQRDREYGIPFDWSKVNRLVPMDEVPRLGDGTDG